MPGSNYRQLLLDIIHYVYHVEISSPLAYKRARTVLLDSMGCAIKTLTQSLDARDFVGPLVSGEPVPNGFRLPGTALILGPVKGAFDFGLLIRQLDNNDTFPGANYGHPGDIVGPIVAVADWLSRGHAAGDEGGKPITLEDVLTAQIKAYEIQSVLSRLESFPIDDIDHGVSITVAAAAVVAHLMGLSEERALKALGEAFLNSNRFRAFVFPPGLRPPKGTTIGMACSCAVQICLLTKSEMAADLETTLSSVAMAEPSMGFDDVSSDELRIPRDCAAFAMEHDFFKLVVADEHGIAASEAAAELGFRLEAMGCAASDIEKITIRTHRVAKLNLDKAGPLGNLADRFRSIQYIVAVSLMKGFIIDGDDYADRSPWASDPRVDALRGKMVIVEDELFTRDHDNPEVGSRASAIQVELKTGQGVPEKVVEFPIGDPKHSKTVDFVQKRFRANMNRGGFDRATVDSAMRLVQTNNLAIHYFVDLFEKEVGYVQG